MVATQGRSPNLRSASQKSQWSTGSCVMPSLTPRNRSGPPMKRPPHIVGARGSQPPGDKAGGPWYVNAAKELPRDTGADWGHVGVVGSPHLPQEDMGTTTRPQSRGSTTLNALPGRSSPPQGDTSWFLGDEYGPGCTGVQAPRPDTCHLTHVYVKQEISHLARRVDEIARYFIALEQMVGTGAIGPLLNKSLHELEAKIETADTIEDIDEAQGFIDAAVRLGISPKQYAPLRSRLTWLESGMRREELKRQLAELRYDADNEEAKDADWLQQLIDNATRLGIDAAEVAIARQKLQEVQQTRLDDEMLAAAALGDIVTAGKLVERGARTGARMTKGGSSLWHIAAVSSDVKIASFAAKLGCDVHLTDDTGHTALMVAALQQNHVVLKQLLECGANPDAQTLPMEHLIECENEAAVAQVRAPLGRSDDRRLSSSLQVAGLHLDIGDKLVGGDDLQLPVFRRVAGRTVLHLIVSRAGAEGAEVPILDTLIHFSADVNACDELGRTPLWYAAQAGRAGSVRTLLRHGASAIVGGGISPLVAAARSHTQATDAGNAKAAAELVEVLRLLLTHGAGSEMRDAMLSFNGDMSAACREASGLHDAIEMSGGTTAELDELRAAIHACQMRCADRLVLERGPRLKSAAEVAAFAVTALPDFEALSFQLARLTGGRAALCRPPTANRVLRSARAAGLVHDSSVDWYRVTGVVHGSLIYQDMQSVRQALCSIEEECGHRMRSIQDCLLVPAPGARGGLSLLLEVCGVLCSLNLTTVHVVELEERSLADGRWMREELASAISRGSLAEVTETMEYAAEHMETLRIAQVLSMPLTTMAYSPTGLPGGMFGGDPAVCVAVRAGHANILEYLLKCHASPSVCAADGESALMHACLCRSLSCFWLLLSSGADTSGVEMERVRGGDFKAEARRMMTQVSTQRRIDGLALAELVERFDGSTTACKLVQGLLESGTDANTWTSGQGIEGLRMPLLSCATRQTSAPLVLLLLKFGARVRDTAGPHSVLRLAKGTPLEVMISRRANEEMQLAMVATDVQAIHQLLEAGMPTEYVAAESQISREGRTLMEYAVDLPVELGVPLLEDLLQRGANVNQVGCNSQTVLQTVVQACASIKYVEVLLSHGADPRLANKQGVTAAMLAAATGSSHALVLILDAGQSMGVDIGQTQDLSGKDAIMHALAALQADIVDMLLVRDYHLDKLGCIAELFKACRDANLLRTKRLLDIIIPVYPAIAAATEDGVEATALPIMPTLLMEAVRSQHVELVKLVLAHGACIYPCRECCPSGDDISDLVTPSLLRESAWTLAGKNMALCAGLRSSFPAELLSIACRNNAMAAANLTMEEAWGLIAEPEDFKVSDGEGMGALDYTLINNNNDMEIWFCSRGACYQNAQCRKSALLEPAKTGDVATIVRRLRAGVDINATDASGYTALDWSLLAAIMNGHLWLCVEHAMETSQQNQIPDHTSRPSILSTGLKRGGDHLSASNSSSLMSTSVGGSTMGSTMGSKPHFDMPDEVIEIGLPRVGEDPHNFGPRDHLGSWLAAPKRKTSITGMSVTGVSMRSGTIATSMATSARSAGGHSRRKRPDPQPDPRGVHSLVEEELVKAGACLGTLVRKARYVLWEPLLRKDFDAVRRRITAGADCTIVNEKGTALTHFALDLSSPGVVSCLVMAGASADSRDHRGRTVLWRAIEMKQPELAEVCVQQGANLHLGIGDKNQGSLAHLAVETKQPQLAIKLLRAPDGCSPNDVAGGIRTLTWRAVELQLPEVVRECLEHNADLSAKDSFTGRTIVHAALDLQPELVPDLIKARAPVDVEDDNGKMPLQIAARIGDEQAVEALLQGGARAGRFGGQAALEALNAGHRDLATRLVEVAGPAPPLRNSNSKRQDADSDDDCMSVGGRSATSFVSGFSTSTRGGEGRRVKRSHTNSTFEDETTSLLLAGAVGSGARDLVIIFYTNALCGACVEKGYACALAKDLTDWVLAGDSKEAVVKRAEKVQELPYLIFEEGADVAASDYLSCGMPEQLIQKIADTELDLTLARRGSFRKLPARRGSHGRKESTSALDTETLLAPTPRNRRTSSKRRSIPNQSSTPDPSAEPEEQDSGSPRKESITIRLPVESPPSNMGDDASDSQQN